MFEHLNIVSIHMLQDFVVQKGSEQLKNYKEKKIARWLDTVPNLRYIHLIKINSPEYEFHH